MFAKPVPGALALALLLATPVVCQSTERLVELDQAVIAAAAAVPASPAEMQTALAPLLGTVELEDISDRSLAAEAEHGLEALVLTTRGLRQRRHDITCTTVTADMARQVWHIQETAETTWDIPDVLRFLLHATRAVVDAPDLQQVSYCVGALHLSEDEIDLAAMDAWYDRLTDLFTGMGLQAVREPPNADNYPAGYLQGRGRACDGTACILIATPWAAIWGDPASGQVSLSVLSVRTVD